ncbi:MAG: putative bifunctional diguanylate cyclase/phosphodiesterase [Actinomycetes bacterium]
MTSSRPAATWVGTFAVNALLAVGCAAVSLPADALTDTTEPVGLIRPASGLALAALLMGGLRLWPGVLVGALVAEAVAGELWPAGPALAAAGATEAVLGALIAVRVGDIVGRPDLTRTRQVFGLACGALGGAAVAGALAAPGVASVAGVDLADAGQQTFVWGLREALGAVLVAPLLLALVRMTRGVRARAAGGTRIWLPRPWLLAEAVVLAAAFGCVLWVAYSRATPAYLLVPLLVVSAIRFGPLGGAVSAAVVGVVLLRAVEEGAGPYASLDELSGFTHTAVFLVLFGTGSLLVQAGYRERSLAMRALSDQADELVHANTDLGASNTDLAGRTAELERAYADLARSEERFRLTFDHAPVGVLLTSLSGECVRANAAFCTIAGRTQDQLLGSVTEQQVHPEDRALASATREELLASPREAQGWEMRFLRPDGTSVWGKVNGAVEHDDIGQPLYLLYLVEDVSERKQAEVRLAHMAFHDALTELPNRALLRDRLEMALRKLSREPGLLAVLFSDLDRFKVINDTMGHDIGDRLLVAVASRLRGALRPGDTVARFGGDEFVVLAEGLPDEAAVAELAGRLHAALGSSFMVGGRELTVGASIGVALGRSPDQRPEDLIQDADAAMYLAKSGGSSRTAFFGEEMRTRLTRRFDLEAGLRRALESGGLALHYQPQVSLVDGHVAGVEALLRCTDERWRALPIPEIIAVAEETGLIVPIGSWVIREACGQLVRWDTQGPHRPVATVSVNLSPYQVVRSDLVDEVRDVLAETGVEPGRLCVEVTESALLVDLDAAVTTLDGLHRLGVRIALDDFGTGYSSLSYLKRLPIDVLKIDRSFVATLGTDSSDAAIVDAVVVMAHRLGITTVGEGVETAEQLRALVNSGSDHGQGYLLSRPVEAYRVIDLVSRLEDHAEAQHGVR